MSTNDFNNKQVMPDEAALAFEIGETKEVLDRICRFIEEVTGPLTWEWKHYGQKSGWTLKLLSKKRNLLFVGPESGYFVIAFVFGDRAVDAVLKSQLPETIKNELLNARKYAEGRGIRFEVRDDNELENIKELIKIKLENSNLL